VLGAKDKTVVLIVLGVKDAEIDAAAVGNADVIVLVDIVNDDVGVSVNFVTVGNTLNDGEVDIEVGIIFVLHNAVGCSVSVVTVGVVLNGALLNASKGALVGDIVVCIALVCSKVGYSEAVGDGNIDGSFEKSLFSTNDTVGWKLSTKVEDG